MDFGIHDHEGRPVALCPVEDDNWRAIADVAPRDDPTEFVAALAAHRYAALGVTTETEGDETVAVYAC